MTWLLIIVSGGGVTAIMTTEAQAKAAVSTLPSVVVSMCISPSGEVVVGKRKANPPETQT